VLATKTSRGACFDDVGCDGAQHPGDTLHPAVADDDGRHLQALRFLAEELGGVTETDGGGGRDTGSSGRSSEEL